MPTTWPASLGWTVVGVIAIATAIAVSHRRRRMLLIRRLGNSGSAKAAASAGTHSGSTGVPLCTRRCITWRFKLSPWTEEQRTHARTIGHNRDMTRRYALRVTESGNELEGFFVFHAPRQLAELSGGLLDDASWRPANFKADWPIVERVFGAEVHTWDARAKPRTQHDPESGDSGGKRGDARGSGALSEGDAVAKPDGAATAAGKRTGPAFFHAGRDFEWEELRARHEAKLLQATAPATTSERGAPVAPVEAAAAIAAQVDGWERHFVRHAAAPSLFFKERRYLLDQFPMLQGPPRAGEVAMRILETGCGNGSSVLPILKGNVHASVHATDPSASAVEQTCDVVRRCGDALAERLTSEVQPDLTEPCSAALAGSFDLALIVFTLSAIPADGDAKLLAATARAVRKGGRVLIRDYGLYDLRHLGDAASSERLVSAPGCPPGCPPGAHPLRPGRKAYQYRRPGGMFRRYYSLEDVEQLAAEAGLEVEESRYLCIRLRNERKDLNMDRVYISAVLRRV